MLMYRTQVTDLIRHERIRTTEAKAKEVRRHVDRVWRYACSWTRSRDAAGDIVQETFLRVARSIKGFKRESSLTTWLFTITRSVTIDHARRSRRARPRSDDARIIRLVQPESAESNDPLESAETRDAVRDAVADLPPAYRDAIVMCELSGLSIRDAAKTLGWTEARVKTTVFRARRKLRDKLKRFVQREPNERRVQNSE